MSYLYSTGLPKFVFKENVKINIYAYISVTENKLYYILSRAIVTNIFTIIFLTAVYHFE